MSKFMYGISRQKACCNFRFYLSNDYFDFLEKHGYLDEDCYEMYIDDISYDHDGVGNVTCNYICYFGRTRVDFSDLESAQAYSVGYFYDYCIVLFEESFYSLVKDGIISRLSFSVYTSNGYASYSDPIFSTDSVHDISEWLKLSPGFKYILYFIFYTHHDFDVYVNPYDMNLNSYHMLFRDYLFFERDFDNVDLCDYDYIFEFLRLQERLTGYHSYDSCVDGYNIFHLSFRKDKE